MNKAVGKILFLLLLIILFVVAVSTGTAKTPQEYSFGFDNVHQDIEIIPQAFTSYYFDEGDTISDVSTLSGAKYGFGFWVKAEENYNWTTLFSIGDSENYVQLSTRGNPNGNDIGINLSMSQNGIQSRITSSKESTLLIYQYNYIYIRRLGNEIQIFLNGDKVASGLALYDQKLFSKYTMNVGVSDLFNDYPLKGYMTNFDVDIKPLSDEQIMKEYSKHNLNLCSFYSETYSLSLGNLDLDFSDLRNYRSCNDITKSWIYPEEVIVDFDGEIIKFNDFIHTRNYQVKLQLSDSQSVIVKTLSYQEDVFADNNANIRNFLENFPLVMHSGTTIPTKLDNGLEIEWSTESENISIKDGLIRKLSLETSKLEVDLVAHIKGVNYQKEFRFEVTVIDEEFAHLMSYFSEEDMNSNSIRFAYSFNGLDWIAINNGEAILKSDIIESSGWIRDPFIFRLNNGDFIVLATQGWDNSSIYFWSSKDLVNFEQHKLINIAYYEPGFKLTGQRAWAPEVFFDGFSKTYRIIFSDPIGGSIYSVDTVSFESFTYPKIFLDTGYPIIDATIVKSYSGNLVYFKDERDGVLTIFTGFSKTLDFSHSFIYDSMFLSNYKGLEGPFIVDLIDSSQQLLYVDQYLSGTQKVFKIINPLYLRRSSKR